MTIEAAEVRRLSRLVGWPMEKQKAFLVAKGDSDWDTAKESTIATATNALTDTAKMFGIKTNRQSRVKLYEPPEDTST